MVFGSCWPNGVDVGRDCIRAFVFTVSTLVFRNIHEFLDDDSDSLINVELLATIGVEICEDDDDEGFDSCKTSELFLKTILRLFVLGSGALNFRFSFDICNFCKSFSLSMLILSIVLSPLLLSLFEWYASFESSKYTLKELVEALTAGLNASLKYELVLFLLFGGSAICSVDVPDEQLVSQESCCFWDI